MKDQPLPLNSAVDLWPWVHFNLGFLTSFGRLYLQECFALSPLYEEKTRIPKSTLAKQNGDSMTGKQNILRPSLKVTIHQPLLIM